MRTDRSGSVLLSSLLLLSLLAPLLVSIAITSVGTVEAGSGENWVVVSYSPQISNYAVAVVGAKENIYIANSTTGGTNHFMRYNTVTGVWTPTPQNPPQWFKNGTCFAWDNGNYIYTLFGEAYDKPTARRYFYRYKISTNTWENLENTPGSVGQGAGDAITWVPGSALGDNDNYIFAIVGNKDAGPSFWRYTISSNTWVSKASPPGRTDDGCSLVWIGSTYLYALRGEYDETSPCYDFWRYNIEDNTWQTRQSIPAFPHDNIGTDNGRGGVGDGGSLLWVGGSHSDYIYALSGNQCFPEPIWDNRFYRYSISTDNWVRLADLPKGVGDQNGPRLGFAGENIYCWRGTYNDPPNGGENDKVLWAYTVKNEENPTRPVLISPENNTFTSDNTPTFVWTRGSNADNHRIEVDNDSDFSSPIDNVVVASPNDNTWTKPSPGYANGTYYWRVWAKNAYGENVSDNTWQFTIVTIPWTGTTTITLENAYAVTIDLDGDFFAGENLVAKFYLYKGLIYQDNTIVCSENIPGHVTLLENISRPGKGAIQRVELVVVDNVGIQLGTIRVYESSKTDLMGRLGIIDMNWPITSPEKKSQYMAEFGDIDLNWPTAPLTFEDP